jgi:hypothetical protein
MQRPFGAVNVKTVERQSLDNEPSDISRRNLTDPKVHGLTEPGTYKFTGGPAFISCMLIQLRSNPVTDLPSQRNTCKAIREFDPPEFLNDWFQDRFTEL